MLLSIRLMSQPRSMKLLSAVDRSHCSELQLHKVLRINDWILSSKRSICIKPSSQLSGKDHGTYQKFMHWGSKSWKDKGYYNLLSIGRDMANALEFTTELINYIRHKHDWPPGILIWLDYDLLGLPLINVDLADIENYRGRKNHYSLVLQLLKLLVSRLPMLPTYVCVCVNI